MSVTPDGRGVVSHAGSRLLADLADRTTLTGRLSDALAGLGRPRAVHDPGRVLVDLAVAVAGGAECISDIAVLADQPALFGAVASDSTVWRLLAQLGDRQLAAVAAAAGGGPGGRLGAAGRGPAERAGVVQRDRVRGHLVLPRREHGRQARAGRRPPF